MKRLFTALAASLLFIGLCFVFYNTREVQILNCKVPVCTPELTFEGGEITDIYELCDSLEGFNKLEKVNLGTYPVYPEEGKLLSEKFPHISFDYIPYITLYGKGFPKDTKELDLTKCAVTDIGALTEIIPDFSALEKVILGENTVGEAQSKKLITSFPGIEFSMCVVYDIYGATVREDVSHLNLTGALIDENLGERLKVMKNLSTVDLHGTGITNEELLLLYSLHPNVEFKADALLGGQLFDSSTEFIDLNWVNITDFEAFKANLRLFPHLTKIEMCGCGLSNEQMEELCNLYPNTRFVWRVYFGQWSVRTDAVAFSVLIRNYEHKRLTSKDIEVLKYCTDLQALDLGHQAITDISVIGDYLPNLRVLILADNRITDLSPLTKLKHLHYLEFFVNQVTDLSPLAECRELVDLNISYNYRINDITPLLDLPLLERLWLERTSVSAKDVALLRKTYPNTRIINIGEGSVDQGWRTHKRYYAMLNMYYNDYISEEFSKYDGLKSLDELPA